VKLDLSGIHVIAANVIKSDPADPQKYFDLLKDWEAQVVAAGGTWRSLVASPDQLPKLVSGLWKTPMKRLVLITATLALTATLAAGCSKPTALASNANAKGSITVAAAPPKTPAARTAAGSAGRSRR